MAAIQLQYRSQHSTMLVMLKRWVNFFCASMSFFAGILGCSSALAQQIVPAGQFYIEGVRFDCGPVVTVLYSGGGDIATATSGSININWPMFSAMPPAVQAFVYAHECAHHLFGLDENVADCWAIKIGRTQGFLSKGDIVDICQAVWMSPGDWAHFPGPVRCANMSACFG